MAVPYVYVRTHSVALPGSEPVPDTEDTDGVTLTWCASFDGALGGGGDQAVDWSIIKVAEFDGGVPSPGVMVEPFLSGVADIPRARTGPYNRDEVGYGWPTIDTVIPNIEEATGLCALLVTYGAETSWAYFLVRRRTEDTRALICYPFSTLAAYSGGSGSGDSAETYRNVYSSLGVQRTRRVSLDRPFKDFAHNGAKEALCVQHPATLQWFLEAYRGASSVDVCTSFDLHSDPDVLDGVTLLISVGHDEYWSNGMRDRVQAFVAGGGNAAFFSGNTAWWKVRFEEDDRTMVCFKTPIEEPLSTHAEGLTAHFCDAPAAGFPDSHEDGEENTLTGVSFRRGILGASALGYTVLDADDDSEWGDYGIDYFAGIPGGPATYGMTFGAGVFQLEADGAEYELDGEDGPPVLTGRDGTPSNFRILAALDLRTETAVSQRGVATLGYYTNVGTVFTAATTDWAPTLSGPGIDDVVVQITKNVIDDLYAAHSRAAWSLPDRVYPPSSWEQLEMFEEAVSAITSVMQGQLLMQGEAATFARDAENPATELAAPTVEFDGDLLSYGSDQWGTYIFGGTADGELRILRGGVNSAEGWDDAVGPLDPSDAGLPVGIVGWNSSPLVMLRDGETTTLYKVFTPSNTWRKLGAVYPPIRAMTGFDGMLFGVRDGGPPRGATSNSDDQLDLYCREGSNIDLTWTKIGTVPARTYAIAAYFGRLYALQAEALEDPPASPTTTLYWRTALADAGLPLQPPSMLFLYGATFALGRMSSGGAFDETGSGELDFSYTHATRANDGLVFFYDRPTQSGVIVRFAEDGTYVKVKEFASSAFEQWDLMAYVRCGYRDWSDYSDVSAMGEKILFYRNDGNASIGTFDPDDGDFAEDWNTDALPTNWSHIVCTWAGDLLFYKSSSGAVTWGRIGNDGQYHQTDSGTMATGQDQVVAAGNTYLFFYKDVVPEAPETANAGLNPLHTTLTNVSSFDLGTGRKLASCEHGLVLDYAAATGGANVYGVSADPSATTSSYKDAVSEHGVLLRTYESDVFGAGWDTILGLGRLRFHPSTLPLTGWWRASYAGSPWLGRPSAGSSFGRDLAEETTPPATGTAQNGYDPADFNGENLLLSGVASNVYFGSSGSLFCLFYADTAPAPVSDYADGTFFTDPANAETTFGFTSSGIAGCVLDDTVTYRRIDVACGTGAYHLAQFKFDGANLKARVDGGAWSSVACGPFTPITTSNMQVGLSYGSSSFFDGRMLELGVAAVALTDSDFDNLKRYVNARYGLSL